MQSRGWNFDYARWLSGSFHAAERKFEAAPVNFALEGTWGPLWFLPALILALLLLGAALYLKKERYILPLALILFVLGLLTKAYAQTSYGISLPFRMNPRNGPLIGTLFESGVVAFQAH
jgi:hypothetical protein